MHLNREHHSGNRYKQRFLMGMLHKPAETPILSFTDFSPLACDIVDLKEKKKRIPGMLE